jgi:hypothetical protein
MTKRRVGVSSGNWFEGSQVSKARPGAPFDFTLQYCRGHKLVIALPTRFSESAARDDKGKGLGSIESGCWAETFSPLTTLHTRVTLSFVIPSAAEGSAVPRTFTGNAESHLPQPCHLGPPASRGAGTTRSGEICGFFSRRSYKDTWSPCLLPFFGRSSPSSLNSNSVTCVLSG